MALFVFGAGATRGCSFVDSTIHPCLPPLDTDFFTQLQKIRNRKHSELIEKVMTSVVDLFGNNFDATLETVFTTLEHTLGMIDVTGKSHVFDKTDIVEIRDNLQQSIAAVLEDSLAEKGPDGTSRTTPKPCKHHEKFVNNVLDKNDNIISFNYDCVLDYALRAFGAGKWNAKYGYGFKIKPNATNLHGFEHWQPEGSLVSADRTVHLFKLHGSLNMYVIKGGQFPEVRLKVKPYTNQNPQGKMHFTIIPPEWHKKFDKGVFRVLWGKAAAAIGKTRRIVFIGYSLPHSDMHSTALFRTSLKQGKLSSLVVVNPDREVRRRTRSVLQMGLNSSTKVLSFDTFEDFVAADREIWD